jgi:hypothetical protein
MSEPLPWLIENSVKIALDYLRRSGEMADAKVADRFLLRAVDKMIVRGECRKLMLANRAIDAYRQSKFAP